MKEFTCDDKTTNIKCCLIEKPTGEQFWCVYHPDDGQNKLVFSSSVEDLKNLEDFQNHNLEQITSHLNTIGFDIENTSEDFFGDVEEYASLPSDFIIKLVDVELKTQVKIKFKS